MGTPARHVPFFGAASAGNADAVEQRGLAADWSSSSHVSKSAKNPAKKTLAKTQKTP
jgi:hypothetical protein